MLQHPAIMGLLAGLVTWGFTSLGAAAVGIYNVAAGSSVGMDLSTYTYSAPVVSITQADGQKIRAAGTAQTTENGTTYYTGTIKVSRMVEAVYNNSEEKTIRVCPAT